MDHASFKNSIQNPAPPQGIGSPLEALWWDARGDWARAHQLVDELETPAGMAVHAYLHRKEGELWNAEYWYRRAGQTCRRKELHAEWDALVTALISKSGNSAFTSHQ